MSNYLTKNNVIGYIEQPGDTGALDYDTSIGQVEVSGASSTTRFSAIDVGAYGNSNDDYVGCIIEFISVEAAAQEPNLYLPTMVLAYSDASGTFDIDPLPVAPAVGDTFAIYRPPHKYIAADAATAAGTIRDASLTQADDYWNGSALEGGPYVESVEGDAVTSNMVAIITDFAQTNGVVTSNILYSTAIGDYHEIWVYPDIVDGEIKYEQTPVERGAVTGRPGIVSKLPGLRGGSGSLTFIARGPGKTREGEKTEIHRMLINVFDAIVSSSLTVSNGASVSSIPVSSGTPAAYRAYATEYGDVLVTKSASDPVVPYPSLRYAPALSSTLYPMYIYWPRCVNTYPPTVPDCAFSVKQWRGKVMAEYFWGCRANFKLEGGRGEFLKITADVQAADAMRCANVTNPKRWVQTQTTTTPTKLNHCRVNIGGVEYNCRKFSFDCGFKFAHMDNLSKPNCSDGYIVTDCTPTGSIEIDIDSTNYAAIQNFISGYKKPLMIQWGTRPGYPGIGAIYAFSVQYTGAEFGDVDGKMTMTLPFAVVLDTVTNYIYDMFCLALG